MLAIQPQPQIDENPAETLPQKWNLQVQKPKPNPELAVVLLRTSLVTMELCGEHGMATGQVLLFVELSGAEERRRR